jgi:hypothetical protein
MAAKVHGTAFLYGATGTTGGTVTYTSAQILRYSIRGSDAAVDYVENNDGQRVTMRTDDTTSELDIELAIQSGFTKPVIGNALSFDGVTYAIKSVSDARVQKGWAAYSITAESCEYMTYT